MKETTLNQFRSMFRHQMDQIKSLKKQVRHRTSHSTEKLIILSFFNQVIMLETKSAELAKTEGCLVRQLQQHKEIHNSPLRNSKRKAIKHLKAPKEYE